MDESPELFSLAHAGRVMPGDEIQVSRGGQARTVAAIRVFYRIELEPLADGWPDEPAHLDVPMAGPGSHVFHRPRRPRLVPGVRP